MHQKADVATPLFPTTAFTKKVMDSRPFNQQFWSPGNTASTMASTPASTPASSPPASPFLGFAPAQRGSRFRCCGLFRPRYRSEFRLRIDEEDDRKVEKRDYKFVLAICFAVCVGVLIGGLGATAILRGSSPASDEAPYAAVSAPKAVPQAYLAAQPLNNSCLIPNLDIPMESDKPKTFDACGFVIRSTDEIWNLRGNTEEAIEKYFHEGYINAGSWGRRGVGKKELREGVLKEMAAFPDIKIHINDCACIGNDVNGYKCAMPDVLEGHNTGPSVYGPATGRYARWNGMVQSIVKKNPATGQWQYYAEWGVHDEWALIQQLGLDFKRVPHPPTNPEPLHDCFPLAKFTPEPVYDDYDVKAQKQHYAAKQLRSQK